MDKNPLKASKKGRPSIASIRSIGKKLQIKEFYPQTKHDYLKHTRVNAMVSLLVQWQELTNHQQPHKSIKRLFDIEFQHSFPYALHVLAYIKGISRFPSRGFRSIGSVYVDILKGLPAGQWFLVNGIELELKKQYFDESPIFFDNIYQLSLEVPEDKDYYTAELRLSQLNVESLVIWPSFRSMFCFTAAWGLVDIIYSEPDLSYLSKTAFSP